MLELSGQLNTRAAGLAADAKQKISLGRGLVREDVSAVLFDEPLTVIDPHLKWQLRRKLKQIHHELKLTLIYVTHDQVEALTFADQVVVMTRGRAVQIGSAVRAVRAPAAHLRRPLHRLAGHELPAGARGRRGRRRGGPARLARQRALAGSGALTLGVRPEYVTLAGAERPARCPRTVTQAQDIGTYWLVTARSRRGATTLIARACVRSRADPAGGRRGLARRRRRAHLLLPERGV